MDVEILAVPYDSGHENLRLGCGPGRLLEGGLTDLVRGWGHDTTVHGVQTPEPFRAEIKTTFDLCRRLAEQVRHARDRGKFPLVLSGNCFAALGAISGLEPARLGLIWFDSHGEYNTPETTASGYLDGMGLATATGGCWHTLAASVPGFVPLDEDQVVLVGGNDFDAEEESRLGRSRLVLVSAADIAARGARAAMEPALSRLLARVGHLYVHIDLDVLDPAEARANELAVAGGMSVRAVEETLALVRRRFEIAGAGMAGYDPAFDLEGHAYRAACRILRSLLGNSCPPGH